MKKLFSILAALFFVVASFAQPAWPTINEELTGVPQDLIEASMNYCLNQSIVPAYVKIERVPRVRVRRTLTAQGWIETSRDTTFTERRRNIAEVRRFTATHGRPLLNELIETVNSAPGQLQYKGRTGNTWQWHKVGIRFTDPQGVRQDIPPHDIFVTLLPDGRFELRYSHNPMIQYAAKFNPATTLTSFLPHIVVENGVAYNRTLINGKPWNEVNIEFLIMPWGKTDQNFVWRWWTYGDTPKVTGGHAAIDAWATSITQYPRTDPKGQTLTIQAGPTGRFDASTHTFTYPPNNGKPVYIMLQAEFLPANHKQQEYRSYHLLYQYGHTPQGSGYLWPAKDQDPNKEMY
jgi:hypothetical protein